VDSPQPKHPSEQDRERDAALQFTTGNLKAESRSEQMSQYRLMVDIMGRQIAPTVVSDAFGAMVELVLTSGLWVGYRADGCVTGGRPALPVLQWCCATVVRVKALKMQG
jgi:hypothetical protein